VIESLRPVGRAERADGGEQVGGVRVRVALLAFDLRGDLPLVDPDGAEQARIRCLET